MPDIKPTTQALSRRNRGRVYSAGSKIDRSMDPMVSLAHGYDYQAISQSLTALAGGQFQDAGRLWDAVKADLEIASYLSTRFEPVVGAFSRPHDEILEQPDDDDMVAKCVLNPHDDSMESERQMHWFAEHFGEIFTPEIVTDILHDEFAFAFSINQIIWENWIPRIERWHPSLLYYDRVARAFVAITESNGAEYIHPGSGKWLALSRRSLYMCWMSGQIRGLAQPWLDKAFVRRDWSRFAQLNGNPIKWINGPQGQLLTNKDDKAIIRNTLMQAQHDNVMVVPAGWTCQLISSPSNNGDIFAKRIEDCNKAISLAILGHDASTNPSSRSSAETLIDSQQLGKARSDVNAWNGSFFPQIINSIARIKFGTDEFAPRAKIVANSLAYKTRSAELAGGREPLNQVTPQQRPPTTGIDDGQNQSLPDSAE